MVCCSVFACKVLSLWRDFASAGLSSLLLHDWLWEYLAPKSQRPASDRGQECPDRGVYTPCKTVGSVGAALSGDCMHDSYDVLSCGCLCLENVAVTKEDYTVWIHVYDSVDQMVTVYVTD